MHWLLIPLVGACLIFGAPRVLGAIFGAGWIILVLLGIAFGFVAILNQAYH